MPHSLSMHKKLKCILPPTPLWCSYQVTTFLILISQLPMRLTLHGGSSSGNIENKFLYNQCACSSFSEMRELGCGITTFNSKLKSTGNGSFIYWFIVCLINRNQYWSCTHQDWQSLVELVYHVLIIRHNSLNLVHTNICFFLSSNSSYWVSCTALLNTWCHKVGGAGLPRALRNRR